MSATTLHFPFEEDSTSLTFRVRLTPRARRTGIGGVHGAALKVSVHAAPVEGAANEALIVLLAKAFRVAKRDVAILSGLASREKRVCIRGAARERLLELAAAEDDKL